MTTYESLLNQEIRSNIKRSFFGQIMFYDLCLEIENLKIIIQKGECINLAQLQATTIENAYMITIDPDFLNALTNEQLLFVILHEISHVHHNPCMTFGPRGWYTEFAVDRTAIRRYGVPKEVQLHGIKAIRNYVKQKYNSKICTGFVEVYNFFRKFA